jgi:hypothetical protein
MNIDRSIKLSLEAFNASNLDMEDFEALMRGLDENFEASQNNVQFQKIWAATVAGILVFLEKRKMQNTELTALRQLFHALSNGAAGERGRGPRTSHTPVRIKLSQFPQNSG